MVQHQSISPDPPPNIVVYSGGRTDQVGLSARGGGRGGGCGRGQVKEHASEESEGT